MKKIIISLLAAGVLSVGCSKEENGSSADRTPIRLGVGLRSMSSTKAPVVNDDQVTFGIAGWENSQSETYVDAPLWNTLLSTTASATAQSVTWVNQKYWHADQNVTTYMKAWYPQGSLSGTAVTFANTKGDQDALLAPVVSGNKWDKDGKTVAFRHMTTQLNFKVKSGEGLEAGTKLRSITLKSVQLPTGFDLTKAIDADGAVTYAAAADLAVSGITSDAVTIGTTAQEVGEPVMIRPIAGTTFKVDVVTNKATYIDQVVTVKNASNVEAGSSFTIELEFTQVGIGLTASITPWVEKEGWAIIE